MNIIRTLFILGMVGMLLTGCQGLATDPGAGGQARITVRQGMFANARTGAPFTPFGVNYCVVGEFKTGKRGHATFSPSHYDREFVSTMMQDLQNWGCNTVRVFHAYVAAEDGIIKSRDATELSPDYVANFLDF
ncbi:MAG: hypothetical protein HN380_27000, partial [Victivallales bacterium]|nr:hypothetical protein [Victivallales bacterium]